MVHNDLLLQKPVQETIHLEQPSLYFLQTTIYNLQIDHYFNFYPCMVFRTSNFQAGIGESLELDYITDNSKITIFSYLITSEAFRRQYILYFKLLFSLQFEGDILGFQCSDKEVL
jgi:hypothetical protein